MACNDLNDTDNNYSTVQDGEIPLFTKVSLSENKIKSIAIDKYASKRVMRLFISHLLDEEMVKKSALLERHFSFGTFTFKMVFVRGVITSVQKLSSAMKYNLYVSVDDGTGTLDCFIEENSDLENVRKEVQSKLEDFKELLTNQPESSGVKGALMLLQGSKIRVNNSPRYSDLRIGNIVELIATLNEYNNKRMCFVHNISKVDSSGNLEYLESLLELYQTVYVK